MPRIHTVFASAGCGKTEFCTSLAADFIARRVCSRDQILYTTFQKTAAADAAKRAGITGEAARGLWYRTLHSACLKLLRIPKGNIITPAKMAKFGERMGVEIASDMAVEDDEEADLAQAMLGLQRVRTLSEDSGAVISKLIATYQLSRLTAKSVEELRAARHEPSPYAMRYFGGVDSETYVSVVESYESWKGGQLVDFVDFLEKVVLEPVTLPNWKAVFIDEAQDLSGLQLLVLDKLSQGAENVFYAGDDWQCLPGDERILTPTGERKIEDIKPGDLVISGLKSAKTESFQVLRKIEKPYDGQILEIETEEGSKVRLTPEHKVFVRWSFKKHCVYLMRQENLYRIGMSKDVAFRNCLESNTDGIMPISVHDDALSARKEEILLSLRSGIPTVLFPTRAGSKAPLVIPAEIRREIFNEIHSDVRAAALLKDIGRTWEPIVKKAVWRGKVKRRAINIYPLEFKQSNPMVEFQCGKTRKESNKSRVRKYFRDLSIAREWVESQNIDGDIFERWHFVPQQCFYRIEARNVLPDVCLVPVVRNGSIKMERVKTVKRVQFSGIVYDLEVDKAHNFCAGGVIVSNCIMGFQGASADGFLSLRSKARKIHLPQTHRFGQSIIDLGTQIASRLPEGEPKHILPMPGKRNPIRRIFDLEDASDYPGSKFYLHRHREGCNAIARKLITEGKPFWCERGVNPLGKATSIAGYLAIKKLMRMEVLDGVDMKSLLGVIGASKDIRGERVKLMKRGSHTLLKRMDPTQTITPLELSAHFTEILWDRLRAEDWSLTDVTFADYYKSLGESGFELGSGKEPEITISTIHGSKGRDAESVFVWDETLPKCMTDPGEHRVGYVAVTRTKGPLYIVSSPITTWNMTTYPYLPDGVDVLGE